MKKVCLITIVLFLSLVSGARSEVPEGEIPSLFRQANALYTQGKYPEAIGEYNRVLAEGWESAPLYYNLANAFFKNNELGRAILNYRKAWNLAPQDPEINKNLEYARESLRDDIAALPLSLWARARRAVILQFPLGFWIGLSAVLYFVTALWLLLVLLIRPLKKAAAPVLKVLIPCLAAAIVLSLLAYSFYATPRAIILDPAVSVRYGPAETDAAAFELHEGTEVTVVREKGSWRQIHLPDGQSGWLPADSLGII